MSMLSLSSVSDRMFYAIFIIAGLSLLAFISILLAQLNPPYVDDGIDTYHQPGILIGNIFAEIGPGPFDSDQQMKKFSSAGELRTFLAEVQNYFAELSKAQDYSAYEGAAVYFHNEVIYEGSGSPQLFAAKERLPSEGFGGYLAPLMSSTADILTETGRSESITDSDFSTTNVQVLGVDEADFLKTDGKYAYIVSDNRLTIVDAYPPEGAVIASKTLLDVPQGQALQMFLNGDRLVIFYQDYGEDRVIPEYGYAPTSVYAPSTHALVVDVSNRQNPAIIKNYEVSGQYSNSRMIGSRVFLLTSSGVDYDNPLVPSVRESSAVYSPDIYYFDNPEQSFAFNTVAAIDLESIEDDALLSKTFMIGSASAVYVSENNIYIAYQENPPADYLLANSKDRFFNAILPHLPAGVQDQIRLIDKDASLDSTQKWSRVSELLHDTYDSMSESERSRLLFQIQNEVAEFDSAIARESQKTVVHKISVGGGSILDYVGKGEVPGRLLNQFSMDEHDGKFRVATTSEYSTPQRFVMENNVFVLDSNMKLIGSLEGIAPDESIYAARFMGDRLYLVTFRQIDPFFVIDLSSDNPEELGKLKLPGYSNYLHPYDKDHVIGIGKETSDDGGQILGVKIALFDVSDVSRPQAVDTVMIGGPQTESEVLTDHKALLFDKEKDILSIPLSMAEGYYNPGQRLSPGAEPIKQEGAWTGFYVFGIDDNKQFQLKGTVEHETNYYGMQRSRSFYINDSLYTITPSLMKINDLGDMEEINQVSLDSSGGILESMN